jgi:RNA binding exosome subunit
LNISSVTLSFFVHATEDEDRLLLEVQKAFGLEPNEILREEIEGYFGNTIVSVKAHLVGKRAQEVGERFGIMLSSAAKKSLVSELERSVDEHDSLFLRIDRQRLNEDTIYLSDEEPIRIKIKPGVRSGGRKKMLEKYEELIRG